MVQIARLPGGKRVVSQISEVYGMDPESNRVVIRDIFNLRDGLHLQPTGYLPTFVDGLIAKGLLNLGDLFPKKQNGQVIRPGDAAARPRHA